MSRLQRLAVLGLVGALAMTSTARAQTRPYIGFVYPAGGQQGTTFQIRLGGQGLDSVDAVFVSGKGVTGKVVDYQRKLNPQEIGMLNEQLRELKKKLPKTSTLAGKAPGMGAGMDAGMSSGMDAGMTSGGGSPPIAHGSTEGLIGRIQRRIAEYVQRPACPSIASLAYVEVTVAPNAEPGVRELRVATSRGIFPRWGLEPLG